MESVGLIVGLGNPGPEYERTRHNFGFLVIDAIIEAAETRKSMRLEVLQREGDFQLWRCVLGGSSCLLAKPLTFMNLSGRAVARICGRNGIPAQEVLIVHDELDLPMGRMKLKRGGGSNGHKGIDSTAEHLGSVDFLRLRLGIGRPEHSSQVVSWVLQSFSAAEENGVHEVCAAAFKGLGLLMRRGVTDATQFINAFSWTPPSPSVTVMDTSRGMG